MSGLNKVMLIGHLGADPDVRSLQNGGEVVNFRVATSEGWKDRQTGERRERTEWHTVVVFAEGLVKIAKQYLRKGSKVYVEGKLQTRKWQDNSGQDRYSTEIVLQPFGGEIQLLDRREADPGRHDYSGHGQDGRWSSEGGSGGASSGGYGGGSGAGSSRPSPGPFDSDLDDDVPF